MAARRLIIVLLVLLTVSVVATIVAPNESNDGETRSTGAASTAPAAVEPVDPEPTPAFKIDAGKRIRTVPLEVGKDASLDVHSDKPGTVEILGMGLIAYADPLAPAHFELLPGEPGTYEVKLVEADKVVGRLEVTAPSKPGPAAEPGAKPSAKPAA
jgi:hypothetical protein